MLLRFNVAEFRKLRYEAESLLHEEARDAVDALNDASSWGGYRLHNSNWSHGPGRTIGIAKATQGRVDRVSRLLGGVTPKVKG